MDAMTDILRSHPWFSPADVPVRFTKITDYSLDLEIFAYVATADSTNILKVQTVLLLKFVEARPAAWRSVRCAGSRIGYHQSSGSRPDSGFEFPSCRSASRRAPAAGLSAEWPIGQRIEA